MFICESGDDAVSAAQLRLEPLHSASGEMKAITQRAELMASQGMRVLALAARWVSASEANRVLLHGSAAAEPSPADGAKPVQRSESKLSEKPGADDVKRHGEYTSSWLSVLYYV